MNNRNFFLFSLFSLSALSCSAMETDNNDGEVDCCNSRKFQRYFEENRPNFNKIDFKNLTNTALETTKELHPLLKNINYNRDTINNCINNDLIPTTEKIQQILAEVSIHGEKSECAAKLTIPNKKITRKALRDYEETILEIRLTSLQPKDDALVGDIMISYTSNQNGLEGTVLSFDELPKHQKPRVNFFVELQQLKQEKKNTHAISIETLKKCGASAQECLDNPFDILDETLQADLKSWIADTQRLILSKQRVLPTTKQSNLQQKNNQPIKSIDKIRADQEVLDEQLQAQEAQRLEDEKLKQIAALKQELDAFIRASTIDNAQKSPQAISVKKRNLEILDIVVLDENLGTIDRIVNEIELETIINKLSSLQKNNPNDNAIDGLIKTAIDVLMSQSLISADKKLEIIESSLPEDSIIRINALKKIIDGSEYLKDFCIIALGNGFIAQVKQNTEDIKIISNDRTEILNALAEYQEHDKQTEEERKEQEKRTQRIIKEEVSNLSNDEKNQDLKNITDLAKNVETLNNEVKQQGADISFSLLF